MKRFLRLIKQRLLHTRSIAKLWWVIVLGIWGAFWSVDAVIGKYGNPHVRNVWDTYTAHIPLDWRIGAILALAFFSAMLIEGSFRHHESTVTSHNRSKRDAVAELEKRHVEEVKNLDSTVQSLRAQLDDATHKTRALELKRTKTLDWGGEWKLAEDGFRLHFRSDVKAQRMREMPSRRITWVLRGGDPVTRADIEAVCSKAGQLLLSCPGFDTIVPQDVQAIQTDWQRWLEYLKGSHGLSNILTGDYQDDDDTVIGTLTQGELERVAALSASECVKTASLALRLKHLW